MAVSKPIQFSHECHQLHCLLGTSDSNNSTSVFSYSSAPGSSSSEYKSENASWVVLRTPATPEKEIFKLRQKVKYLAVLPNMEGAVVLIDDGRGILQPFIAYYIADNVIFVCDGSLRSAKTIRMVLYRNPVIVITSSVSGKGVAFSTVDLTTFLYLVGENYIMNKMLEMDGCYTVIDRYTLAMAFIYLKRANVTDYNYTNIHYVMASLLLAHKIEEDEQPGRALLELIYYALPRAITDSEKLGFLNSVASYQSTLFMKIGYRGYVSVDECEEVIAVAPYHPFWKRWRLSFHGGAVRDSYQAWKLQFVQASFSADTTVSANKCIMCKGNHHYSKDVQDRFAMQSSFCTQKLHLTHILTAVADKHQKNLRRAASCPETGHYFARKFFTEWPLNFSFSLSIDINWPLEYVQLLDVENQIEAILCDEKYLQKYVSLLKMKKQFPNFIVPTPPEFECSI